MWGLATVDFAVMSEDEDPVDKYAVFFGPCVWGLGLAAFLIMRIRRRARFAASDKWPVAPARFQDGEVRVLSGGRQYGTWYGVYASFEYSALGAIYYGKFHQGQFQDPGPPGRLLERIKAGKMDVRYNPANPADYFVDTDRDIRA
jgi:hypothetical protein